MSDLVTQALRRLPSETAVQAEQVAYRVAAGWKVREIGAHLDLTWREVNDLREQTSQAVIAQLRSDGYSEVDVIRLLGVPTAAVHDGRGPVQAVEPVVCPRCNGTVFTWRYPGYFRCGECDQEGGELWGAPTPARLAAMGLA